jgi:hypothetical protein
MDDQQCIYCGSEVSDDSQVPAYDDHDAWDTLAVEHDVDCEWIRTRAHRRQEPDSEDALTERLWQHIWIPVEPQEPDLDDSVDHTAGVLGDLDEQVREV